MMRMMPCLEVNIDVIQREMLIASAREPGGEKTIYLIQCLRNGKRAD
jgi:uncharacterized protein CbrC (UPF0167 family)